MWEGQLSWLEKEVMVRALFDQAEMHGIFHLTSTSQVLELIKKIHADRRKMEHVCVNHNK